MTSCRHRRRDPPNLFLLLLLFLYAVLPSENALSLMHHRIKQVRVFELLQPFDNLFNAPRVSRISHLKWGGREVSLFFPEPLTQSNFTCDMSGPLSALSTSNGAASSSPKASCFSSLATTASSSSPSSPSDIEKQR